MMKISRQFLLSFLSLIFINYYVSAQARIAELREAFLDPHSEKVLVAAHRAAHNEFPENSIAAIQKAIDLGVHIIEIDVKVTKDGIPILMHDGTIDRTTTGKGNPEGFTFEEINQFFLVENGKATTHKIPTLEEALKVSHGKILVDLDLKSEKIYPIMDVVVKTNSMENVFFFDSDYEVLKKVKAEDEDFMLMPRAYSLEMADSAIALFAPEVVHIDQKFYTEKVVTSIRNAGARVWINALGKPDQAIRAGKISSVMEELLIYKANIIQTDEPKRLLEYLETNPGTN
ncbi:glycerophosphodiester phosphodiesterase family protein [Flexithrix dorotheae]|uniref:glycerophosphodiester phosphodiesterase family protein n=1 Tax=Flexithrix dorotheae TaxID=70993 RepID=UPI001FE11F74|nr:glycerophosphodiester phosphodiesterase family protein [Flexithrix dorotheae]